MKVSAKQRIMYVAGDLLACEAATLLFNFVRHLRIHNGGDIGFAEWSADPYVELSYLAFPAVMLAIFALLGFYNDPLYKSRYETRDQCGSRFGVRFACDLFRHHGQR